MPRQHAATVFLDKFADGNTGRRQVNTGFLYPAAHGERAQALATVPAVGIEPVRSLFDNIPYPMQGFHVLFQGGAIEQAHLRHVGRAQARHTTLAFYGFKHGGFFAADISPGAAAQMDRGQRARRVPLQCRQLSLQQGAAAGVFIAQINIDRLCFNGPTGDQCAFDKAVRVSFQVVTILESPRFAFIGVNRYQPGAGLTPQDTPFPACRETGATQATQVGVFQQGYDLFRCILAVHAIHQQLIAAFLPVAGVADGVRLRA